MNHREEKINQIRFMILTIASDCIAGNCTFNILPMLKRLRRLALKQLDDPIKELIKDKKDLLTQECWYFSVCQKLTLDNEEITTLIPLDCIPED